MIPINLLEVQILLALLCTAYSWGVHDKNNYTDAIAGIVGTIFWWTSGLCTLGGVQSQDGTYASAWFMWIFIGIGIVTALITFVKIVDILNSRKDHVDMSFDYRI